jgi:hypothetical protein
MTDDLWPPTHGVLPHRACPRGRLALLEYLLHARRHATDPPDIPTAPTTSPPTISGRPPANMTSPPLLFSDTTDVRERDGMPVVNDIAVRRGRKAFVPRTATTLGTPVPPLPAAWRP